MAVATGTSGDGSDRTASARADAPVDTSMGIVMAHHLYLLSGMVDVLRDVTGLFVAQGIDPGRAAVDQIVDQYRHLRSQIPSTLTPAAGQEFSTWAVPLEPTVTLPHLHLTLASVARYLDALLQAPQFATQHRLLVAATDQTNQQLDNGGGAQFVHRGGAGGASAVAIDGYRGGGAYL